MLDGPRENGGHVIDAFSRFLEGEGLQNFLDKSSACYCMKCIDRGESHNF